MTTQEFKRVGRLLKEVYKELEAEALKDGLDIFGDKYKQLQDVVRMQVLSRLGYTLEEYQKAKAIVLQAQNGKTTKKIQENSDNIEMLSEVISELEIPDEEELLEKAKKIAEAVVKPPVIKKEIVERTTIEKPTIVKETVNNTYREEYEDGPLWAELGYLEDRINNLPEPTEPDYEKLKEEIRNDFAVFLEHNTKVFDMPDFRRLAMGLQAQIDTKIEGVGVTKLTVSDTAPDSPNTNDLWIDTNAYPYQSITGTYSITDEDYLLDCSGTFTITLPTAVSFLGEYIIKNSSDGIITVATTSSQTIDGESTILLNQNDSLVVRSDGANWIII